MTKKPDTAAALAGILAAKRGDERPADLPVVATPRAETAAVAEPSPAAVATVTSPRSRGKKEEPKGKRDHPDYCQANAYIPKSVRRAVNKTLLDIDGMDYSSLVEDLLRKWLKSRGVSA